jgi:hypothetical protein
VKLHVLRNGQSPLDDFVMVPLNTQTAIDVLGWATGAAPFAELQPPLSLVSVAPPSLAGATRVVSPYDPVQILYTYAPSPDQSHTAGRHPTDALSYKVKDSNGRTATGTVQITISTPPRITVQPHAPTDYEGDHTWQVPHGTRGPLTGDIDLADADGDPLTLVISAQALHGQVSLTQVSPTHYVYQYDPPTTYDHDHYTGFTTKISAIVGDDQFTLEASDGSAVTDYTISFDVHDHPPVRAFLPGQSQVDPALPPNIDFVVPENTGESYYTVPGHSDSIVPVAGDLYDPTLDTPGLVHFAAPGVLWDWSDPDPDSPNYPFGGDPLMALPDDTRKPRHGHVYLFPDGSFNYTPDPGFTGTDSFGYYASDGYQVGTTVLQGFPPDELFDGSITLHVVASVGQTPAAPILHDYHESLTLMNPSVRGSFANPITRNNYIPRGNPNVRISAAVPIDRWFVDGTIVANPLTPRFTNFTTSCEPSTHRRAQSV